MVPNGARKIFFLLIQTLPTFWATRISILRTFIFGIFWIPMFQISRSQNPDPGPQNIRSWSQGYMGEKCLQEFGPIFFDVFSKISYPGSIKLFLLGGCRPPDPLLFLGGFQPPRPPGGGPAAPRAPLHTERLRLSGSPFFLGTKILEAPNLWYVAAGAFFFSENWPPYF